MKSLLRLEKYELRALSVVWHELQDAEAGVELIPSFDYNMRVNKDDPRRFALEFECGVSSKGRRKEAFEIRVLMTGYLACPEEWEEDKCAGRALVNGSTILYGIVRGLVATATGQFPYGTYFMPSVNMIDVLKHVEQAKERSRRKKSGTATKVKEPTVKLAKTGNAKKKKR